VGRCVREAVVGVEGCSQVGHSGVGVRVSLAFGSDAEVPQVGWSMVVAPVGSGVKGS